MRIFLSSSWLSHRHGLDQCIRFSCVVIVNTVSRIIFHAASGKKKKGITAIHPQTWKNSGVQTCGPAASPEALSCPYHCSQPGRGSISQREAHSPQREFLQNMQSRVLTHTPIIEQTSVSSNAREQEHYVPGTVLGTGVPTMSKRDRALVFQELIFQSGTSINQINLQI